MRLTEMTGKSSDALAGGGGRPRACLRLRRVSAVQSAALLAAGLIVSFTLCPERLALAGSISGTVTQLVGGLPIENVRVNANATVPGGTFGTAVTDALGNYTISGLAAGSYLVQAQAEPPLTDHLATSWYPGQLDNADASPVVVSGGGSVTGIDFALSGVAGGLSGTVVDGTAGDAPIANAGVSITTDAGDFVLQVNTDTFGVFDTAFRLAPGDYTFQVTSTGAVSGLAHLWAGGTNHALAAGTATFTVSDGATADAGTLALTVGRRITGQVTNASTALPIPGVFINVHDAASEAFVAGGILTDGSGNYDTGAILPEGSYTLNDYAPGFVQEWWDNHLFSSQADPILLSGGDATGKNFALTPGGSISGVVRDGSAVGIGGVTVSASSTTPDTVGTTTTTASDGTYTLSGLLTGTYKVQALPAGVPPVGGQSFALQWYSGRLDSFTADPVSVTAPGTASGKNFVLALGAGSISGIVMNGGSAIPFADVQIFRATGDFVMSVRASGAGIFSTGRVLPPGSYLVRAGPGFGTSGFGTLYYPGVIGFPAATPVIISGGNDDKTGINFDLPVAGGITGTITCAAVGPLCPFIGAPVAGAQVNIDDFATGTFVAGTLVTDATGHYNTGRILAPGNYKVQVFASGFVEQWAFGKDFNNADAVAVSSSFDTDVSLALVLAGSISGTVFCTPAAGGPGCNGSGRLAGATVKVDLQNGGNFRQTVTASDGTYTVSGFPAAPNYKVQAVGQGFATRFYNGQTSALAPDLVSVSGGLTTPGIDFTLPAGAGGVSGTITRQSNGQPIPNAGGVCLNLATGGFVLCVGTDGSGHYDTGLTLGAGDYKVQGPAVPGLVQQWYSGKVTFNTADAVTVTSGNTATVNFSLPTGGGITGHVTCVPLSGPGCNVLGQLTGAIVDVFDATGNFIVGGFGTLITDATGFYSTGRVLDPATTYKVRARSTGFLTEFFHTPGGSVPTIGAATPVTVVGGIDQTNTDIALPVGTGIAGTIRNATNSAAIAGAVVEIYDFATGGFLLGPDISGSSGLITNGSGQYSTGTVLPPGDYKVRAHKSGFQDRFYASALDLASATSVTTTSGTVPGIDIGLQPNPPPPLTLRDSFDGTAIDQTLWAGGNLESMRQITAGKADLRLTVANTNLNNNLRFANEVIDPSVDFSIQADVALSTVDLSGMRTRARINFGLLNMNVGPPAPNDQTDDVQVEFALEHTGSTYRSFIDVFRCSDAACANGSDLFFSGAAFDPGLLGSTHTMSVSWNASTKVLAFGFDGQAPVSVTIPVASPRAVNVPFKNLSVRVRDASGGTGAGKSGSASATFDNVMVNGALYDDFSAGQLDPAKWKDLELTRQIGGGVFTSSVRRIGANGSNTMNLANANAVTTMQADVAVTAVQNTAASPQARLVGGFYNNGTGSSGDQTGDVLAGIGISHDGASQRGFFFVSRCLNASCNIPGEFELLTFDETTFGLVDPGTTHRLSLAWDPVGHVFTFGFDGVTHTVAPTGFAGFELGNAAPNVAFKGIGTRVGGIGVPPAPGEGGTISATFDNFFAGNFVSGRVTTGVGVTELAGATVTAYATGSPVSTAPSGGDGTYTIPDLPAGTYQIGAHAAGFIDRFYRGKSSLGGADPVAVSTGGAVVGVNLALTVVGAGTTSRALGAPVVVIPGAGQALGSIEIDEKGVGALAPGAITLTLPGGFVFAARPTVSTMVGNELQVTQGADPTGGSVFSFLVTAGSQDNAGKLLVSGIKITAAGAGLGPVLVTLGGTAGVTPSAAQAGTAVAASTAPTLDPAVSVAAGQGASPQTVVVTGVNFTGGASGSKICIGTVGPGGICMFPAGITVGPTTFVNGSQLTVAVTVAPGVIPGVFNLNVVNQATGEVSTLPGGFKVTLAPTVTGTDRQVASCTPSGSTSLSRGEHHPTVVTITGAGFDTQGPIQVLFSPGSGITAIDNSVELLALLSGPAITVEVDVADTAPLGPVSVTVVNPDGGSNPTAAGAFVTVALPCPSGPGSLPAPKSKPGPPPPPPPGITTLSPGAGLLGSHVIIAGSGFGTTPAANVVTFTGVNGARVTATVNAASAGSLDVNVPPQAIDGAVTVAVNGVLSNAMNFTVTDPKLVAVSPSSGTQGKPTFALQLTGTKFAAGASVTLSPSDLNVVLGAPTIDSTTIQVPVTVGSSALAGLRDVTVANPGGGVSTLPQAFEIKSPVKGALALSLVGMATASYLPSVSAVSVTLDGTGKCTAKTLTPASVTLQAEYVSDLSPTPPASVTFSLASSAFPGTATNEDCELASPPANDWSVATPDPTSQQVTVAATTPGSRFYQVTLYSFDMGGTVTITAQASGDPTIAGTLALPVDSDRDGLPDAYENLYPVTLSPLNGDQDGNGIPDGQDRFARDGLSNFAKYRGVFLVGPANGTGGLLPAASFQRLDPGRRHLFVRGRGFGNDALMPAGTCGMNPVGFVPISDGNLSVLNPCPPFAVGAAFESRGVRVIDGTGSFTASTQLPARSFANPAVATLDLMTVIYDGWNCNAQEACDQDTKSTTGVRQFQFPTLGASNFGGANFYGTGKVLKRAVEAYFRYRPYQHRVNDPSRVVLGADGRPMLAPIILVADANDNGIRDSGEAVDASGNLLGDTYISGTGSQTLTAMDVNNDGCVELPFVPDPTKISGTCDPAALGAASPQATKRQVVRNIVTHEMGHAAGINIHTTDPNDLMYQYTVNWIREGFFSDTAASLLQIHNKGLQ